MASMRGHEGAAVGMEAMGEGRRALALGGRVLRQASPASPMRNQERQPLRVPRLACCLPEACRRPDATPPTS